LYADVYRRSSQNSCQELDRIIKIYLNEYQAKKSKGFVYDNSKTPDQRKGVSVQSVLIIQTMKYFHHCLTIDHRYLYVPFTCLALHYEEMKCRLLLVVPNLPG